MLVEPGRRPPFVCSYLLPLCRDGGQLELSEILWMRYVAVLADERFWNRLKKISMNARRKGRVICLSVRDIGHAGRNK